MGQGVKRLTGLLPKTRATGGFCPTHFPWQKPPPKERDHIDLYIYFAPGGFCQPLLPTPPLAKAPFAIGKSPWQKPGKSPEPRFYGHFRHSPRGFCQGVSAVRSANLLC